jgi:succinoglycan biosynthesis transport protein ExoP
MTPGDLHPRQLGLSDYLTILNRRKWVIVQTTLIVAIVAFFLSARQDAVYEAQAEVLLTRQNISAVITGVNSPDIYVAPERFAATQAGLARAPVVAERAVAASGITSRTSGDLLGSSRVSASSSADFLGFTVQDSDPAIATTLANAYAQAFTEYKTDLDTAQLSQARKDLERRLAELRRSGQSGTDTYRELSDNAQRLRTMELLQTPNRLIQPALGAGQIAPTPRRNATLGAFLGLLLGLGIAFLWETLDKRVRTEEEVERRLGLPLLSRLPEPPRRLGRENRLTMIDDPQDAHAEAIRRLRTNLEFANVDGAAHVIMVTSAVEREGKSTTIANLAVALARSGRSVVLVDLDLRQPTIANFFDLHGRPGITDVVLGRAELATALTTIRLPVQASLPQSANGRVGSTGRIRVLPSGPLPANPGELVGTQSLARVLDGLRADAEFVLLDAPPLLSVGDAMTLSARADAILLVTHLGIVQRKMLADVSRELAASPARKLGFVVTGADVRDTYGYGYGHRRPRVPEPAPEIEETPQAVERRTRWRAASDR